jgi:hypothetical protein
MSVERWAMIQDGTVINVCLWDGLESTWTPPDGVEMQPAPDYVAIGWRWDGAEWLEPIPVEEPAAPSED